MSLREIHGRLPARLADALAERAGRQVSPWSFIFYWKNEKCDNYEKLEKSRKLEKPNKPEETGKPEKPGKSKKPDNVEKPQKVDEKL